MPQHGNPIHLSLRALPAIAGTRTAGCPLCSNRTVRGIGLIGLHIVVRCERCGVRFFRDLRRRGFA